jgi:hypothetical protein
MHAWAWQRRVVRVAGPAALLIAESSEYTLCVSFSFSFLIVLLRFYSFPV